MAGTVPNPGRSAVLGTPPASFDDHTSGPADPSMLSTSLHLPGGSPLQNPGGRGGAAAVHARERDGVSSRLLCTPRAASKAYAGVSGILHSEGAPAVAMSSRNGTTHLFAHNDTGDSATVPFGTGASTGLAPQVCTEGPARAACAWPQTCPLNPRSPPHSVRRRAAQNAVIMTTITASKPQDAGPYHAANATMRSVLPHYDADVKVRTDWGLVLIVLVSLASLLVYAAVRLWQLATGRTAEYAEEGPRVKV